jgi:hypothetical protein
MIKDMQPEGSYRYGKRWRSIKKIEKKRVVERNEM